MNHTIQQQNVLRGQHSVMRERLERERNRRKIRRVMVTSFAVMAAMVAVILWVEAK